jgi:hypothetical protein
MIDPRLTSPDANRSSSLLEEVSDGLANGSSANVFVVSKGSLSSCR